MFLFEKYQRMKYMDKNFLDVDNFILAYNRLQTYKGDYYKRLYINDLNNFGLNLNINIETLIERIKRDLYKPSNADKIYIPKSDGTVRPVSVLSFIDLLIYQAIANILADVFYDDYKFKTNTYVFGNIYNNSNRKEDEIFFYIPWKEQWKKYNDISIKYYNDGFKYKSEFDLASFYDTIDHTILLGLIKEKIEDERLISVLDMQLKSWSFDHDRTNIKKNHGIPQGPQSSGFLAEIVLNYIDEKMIKYVAKKQSHARYIRYVDDIKIFTTNENEGRRALAYIDLLSRDLGLIPQVNKLGVKLIENRRELVNDNKKLSEIDRYYKKNNKISKSDNKKLIRGLKKDLTIDNLTTKSYNKTNLKFAMYRIAPDYDLKNILVKNINCFYDCFESICYYLSKHFSKDPLVKEFVYNTISKNDIPYNYIIAIIFKYFANVIDFDIKIFDNYYLESGNKNWYIRYYMLDWIYYKSPDTLSLVYNEDKPIVRTKLNYYKYIYMKDENARKLLAETAMKDANIETALSGYSLQIMDLLYLNINKDDLGFNEFIKRIYDIPNSDNYINMILVELYNITTGHCFFNHYYWDEEELTYINEIFKKANDRINDDISIWLNYINTFNHLVTVKLLGAYGYKGFNKKEFSNMLNIDNFMIENFPKSYENFTKINERRNEIPSSHPYAKDGKIGKHLEMSEKVRYEKYFKLSMEEILMIFEGKGLQSV